MTVGSNGAITSLFDKSRNREFVRNVNGRTVNTASYGSGAWQIDSTPQPGNWVYFRGAGNANGKPRTLAQLPFDRMAVLLRAPEQYRVHLEEALSRAGVPVQFDQGTVLPDPSGRALLALLACASEGLSARRFAEYLSLGELPDADADGMPPTASPSGDRWIPPDEELLIAALAVVDDHESPPEPAPVIDAPVAAGGLRAPWRWERLLVEAAVIVGCTESAARARSSRGLRRLRAELIEEARND